MAKKNDRRKKNAAERGADVLEWDIARTDLFDTVHAFYEEFQNSEGDYGWIGVKYYDAMKSANEKTCMAQKRMKKDYVTSNFLQGQWETTTHANVYNPEFA